MRWIFFHALLFFFESWLRIGTFCKDTVLCNPSLCLTYGLAFQGMSVLSALGIPTPCPGSILLCLFIKGDAPPIEMPCWVASKQWLAGECQEVRVLEEGHT